MKFELKRRENYSSLFASIKIPFIPKTIKASVMFYNTPESWVHGYSSRTKSGRYVLFHDYDSLNLQDVIEELKWLQEKFGLSDYHVFELDREESFHAVCLDTLSLAEAYSVQKQTSCDLAFIHSIKTLKTREWILRWGKKGNRSPTKYLLTVKSKHDCRVKSLAHALFLRKLGVKVEGRGKWDGEKEIGFVRYNTANRVKKTS